MASSESINSYYLKQLELLGLPIKAENNPYLVLHMYGDGIRAPTAFNFKVYKGKRGLTLVTNDKPTLDMLLAGESRVDEEGKRIILMDDSGWGFPLGGVLCGAYDFQTDQFYSREVEVKHFQGRNFRNKSYLDRFRDRALEITDEINPDLEQTIIRICTGYVNERAKDALRQRFEVVEVDKIGEPLQTWLEQEHRRYIMNLVGEDLYYDPKILSKIEIARQYNEVMEFIRRNNLLDIAKTGWKPFQKYQ